MLDEVLRNARLVEDPDVFDVDPGVVVEGREDFLELDRTVFGVLAVPVRPADHLPRPHSAPGQETLVRLRPVIAAVVAVDLGGPAELPPDNHGNVPVESPLVEVADER